MTWTARGRRFWRRRGRSPRRAAVIVDMLTVPSGSLEVDVDPGRLWRVGYRPDPWAWTPWEYAGPGGRFGGRWDDPAGEFRTVYAGQSLLACLLEVLAGFRPDLVLQQALDGVDEDPVDAVAHPTVPAGRLPRGWVDPRTATSAELSGVYAAVTRPGSLATVRARFGVLAARWGLVDLDAAALKLAAPRELTQAVARWLYDLPAGERGRRADGVRFDSRHGDGLALWAVFEQPGDPAVSPRVSDVVDQPLGPADPALTEVFAPHRLTWTD
jgi:RES domain-containing protein